MAEVRGSLEVFEKKAKGGAGGGWGKKGGIQGPGGRLGASLGVGGGYNLNSVPTRHDGVRAGREGGAGVRDCETQQSAMQVNRVSSSGLGGIPMPVLDSDDEEEGGKGAGREGKLKGRGREEETEREEKTRLPAIVQRGERVQLSAEEAWNDSNEGEEEGDGGWGVEEGGGEGVELPASGILVKYFRQNVWSSPSPFCAEKQQNLVPDLHDLMLSLSVCALNFGQNLLPPAAGLVQDGVCVFTPIWVRDALAD
eukprot:564624-Rhodomonas_salina.1